MYYCITDEFIFFFRSNKTHNSLIFTLIEFCYRLFGWLVVGMMTSWWMMIILLHWRRMNGNSIPFGDIQSFENPGQKRKKHACMAHSQNFTTTVSIIAYLHTHTTTTSIGSLCIIAYLHTTTTSVWLRGIFPGMHWKEMMMILYRVHTLFVLKSRDEHGNDIWAA